jgi:AcrR family transcriptional regulator
MNSISIFIGATLKVLQTVRTVFNIIIRATVNRAVIDSGKCFILLEIYRCNASDMPKRSSPALRGSESAKPRRTQEARSEAMRQRLLEATLRSLAEDGYAGSTLSSIVRRAGVSRGAQVHHYPNKQALMLDAAENLMRRTYRQFGDALLSISDEEDRLRALVDIVWEQLFATPLFRAYIELVAAAARDAALLHAMQQMFGRVVQTFQPAANYYFETNEISHRADEIFLQLSCLLTGLALQAPLFNDEALVRPQLELWIRQVEPLMHARKGIRKPPPRPSTWDEPLAKQPATPRPQRRA